MYAHTCVCVCVHVSVHACMYVCMYVCAYAYVYVGMSACVHMEAPTKYCCIYAYKKETSCPFRQLFGPRQSETLRELVAQITKPRPLVATGQRANDPGCIMKGLGVGQGDRGSGLARNLDRCSLITKRKYTACHPIQTSV